MVTYGIRYLSEEEGCLGLATALGPDTISKLAAVDVIEKEIIMCHRNPKVMQGDNVGMSKELAQVGLPEDPDFKCLGSFGLGLYPSLFFLGIVGDGALGCRWARNFV